MAPLSNVSGFTWSVNIFPDFMHPVARFMGPGLVTGEWGGGGGGSGREGGGSNLSL